MSTPSAPSTTPSNVEWTGAKVRETFVEYFCEPEKHAGSAPAKVSVKHERVPSSGVVPLNDPTLLFTNAGMNQFKPIFLGTVDPQSAMAGWKAAANTQKCIRAGGKHNDLDDVGKDTYHHTFFEMLGNWSFGDYFKQGAIDMAWDLLTRVYGLPAERLYATYFEGSEKNGLEPDFEARDMWLQYLPADHVLPGDMKDNFWEMGETGPCGPCSELHFDRIGGRNAAHIVNDDDPNVIEIWNLVFMQFNRESDGSLRKLPAQHVDTGMGLERIVSILQNKMSNYDSDLFTPLFAAIKEATGCETPYKGLVGADDVTGFDMAYRVVADHIRTLCMAITDGAAPGPSGRDYVVRRVCRRASRYGRVLGGKPGFFSSLVRTVCDVMGDAFPELRVNPERVERIINAEEMLFAKTLDKGVAQFEKLAKGKAEGGVVSGEEAFQLYQTFGFPVDLTTLMAEEKKLKVDSKGFEAQLEIARQLSREGGGDSGSDQVHMHLDADALDKLSAKLKVPTTNDESKYTADVESLETSGTRALVQQIAVPTAVEGCTEFKDSSSDANLVGLVISNTCFYAESGGQIFDTGVITGPNGSLTVKNTQLFGGYVLHIGSIQGTIKVGDEVVAKIDAARRRPIMANHTMTHILNLSLRKVLTFGGKQDVAADTKNSVEQRGSLVDESKLRFDFSFEKKLTTEELANVEGVCNEIITNDLAISFKEVPLKQALAVQSLRAVFGETYPDPVRVVSIGPSVDDIVADPANFAKWKDFSIELCGGTHLGRTKEAGSFVLLSEGGIQQGVRRIIGATGEVAARATEHGNKLQGSLESLGPQLTHSNADVAAKAKQEFAALQQEIDTSELPLLKKLALQEQASQLIKSLLASSKNAVDASVDAVKHLVEGFQASGFPKFIVHNVEHADGDRKAIDQAFQEFKRSVVNGGPAIPVMCFGVVAGKKDANSAVIMVSVPQGTVEKMSATAWVQAVADIIGGKGGGKPDNAQATGTNVDNLAKLKQVAEEFASSKL